MKLILKYIPSIACFLFITAGTNAQLKLSLESEKPAYKLGEPVSIYVSVTNVGSESASIYKDFSPEMHEYFYLISGPEIDEQVFSPIYIAESYKKITLEGGESAHGIVELYFGAGKYYFSKPGEYNIKVKYQENVSRPLTIRVLDSSTDEERELVTKIFESKELGFYYELGGSDELTEANTIIDDLSENYRDFALTSYFLQVRAESFSRPARNFKSKNPRQPKYDDALNILDQTKHIELPLYYQKKKADLTAKIHNNTGNKDEAIRELESFKATLNNYPSYRKYYIRDLDLSLDKLKD